ncbi:MFS transporter [Chitinophaga sp. 30R24]|uniref:MFS transporter n=1 Tax=Chitinophaga sp. 30R24 TaxID=3248838 RepID=UPI003B8FE01B
MEANSITVTAEVNKQSVPANKSIIYILALGVFGIITTEFGVIGILPQIAEHFHVTIAQAGWLLSAFALTIAFTGPFITLAAAGVNRKIALAFVLVVFIISNLLSAVAPSFWILLFARVLPAFFHPIFFSVAMATAALSARPGEAPKAVSIVFSGVSIGTVLGVPVTVFFADLFDWHAAFVVCSVLNLLALTFLLKFLPSMPVKRKASFGSQVNILKQAKIWWNIATATLIIAGMSTSYGYMAEYLKEIIHMDGKAISLTMFLFGAAGVIGNLLVGRLLSRDMKRTVFTFFAALMIIQALLFVVSGYYYAAFLVTIVWGLIHTGGFLLGQTLITSAAPEAPEFGSSIFVSAGNLGFSLGSIIGGAAIDLVGVAKLPVISIGVLLVALLINVISHTSSRTN